MIQSTHDLLLFFCKDHISFMTNKVDTDHHSHNYIQITIGLEHDFLMTIEEQLLAVKGIILDSNTCHKLYGRQRWQFYVLVNPESVFGERLKRTFLQESCYSVIAADQGARLQQLIIRTLPAIHSSSDYIKFMLSFKKILNLNDTVLDHALDDRIQEVLTYIDQQSLQQLSVKHLSQQIYLSESRLSHLFKEEMGISLVSYILHHKLENAFRYIFKGLTITEAALEAGFSSSSHFTRSVRDKLGMTPKSIVQNSRYLQVKSSENPYI